MKEVKPASALQPSSKEAGVSSLQDIRAKALQAKEQLQAKPHAPPAAAAEASSSRSAPAAAQEAVPQRSTPTAAGTEGASKQSAAAERSMPVLDAEASRKVASAAATAKAPEGKAAAPSAKPGMLQPCVSCLASAEVTCAVQREHKAMTCMLLQQAAPAASGVC